LWRLLPSGKHVASIFTVEEHAKQETRTKQAAAYRLLNAGFLLGLLPSLEDGNDIILRTLCSPLRKLIDVSEEHIIFIFTVEE
jgi:hypothetical protein